MVMYIEGDTLSWGPGKDWSPGHWMLTSGLPLYISHKLYEDTLTVLQLSDESTPILDQNKSKSL